MIGDKTLKDIYNGIPEPKITYESWLRKMHRFAEGNVRTTMRVQRILGITPPTSRKRHYLQDFIAYDGEGYDDKYVLLANSRGERISNPKGLSTEECLKFLSKKYGNAKRVWFSFSYDINHILRDIPDDDLLKLLDNKTIKYKNYSISYIPGKIFTVNYVKQYDVFSFFATNFINVVKLMLGEDRVTKKLVEGKLARGSFDKWDMNDLIEYNDEELTLLVEIMNKLREALLGVDVKLTEWYGPGAIAKYWFKKYKVTAPPIPTSVDLYKALQSAYYGGRFEQIRLGKFKNVYEYDIHSAYPAAMATMPVFNRWYRVKGYQPDSEYSIWHISFDLRPHLIQGFKGALPLPVRSKNGHICFPAVGKGWYWQHEIKIVREFFPKARINIHEGYIAEAGGQPFSWVPPLYEYRQKLKSEGNLSQYPLKVGLNSLYGKTAQTVGSNVYTSLAWAGYITSITRAKIARAGYSTSPENLIGFATDALFTLKKLDLPLSDKLGDWEEQHFDSGIFFQSGVYRLQNENEKAVDKYRGSPLRKGIDDIIIQLKDNPSQYPSIKIGRFISLLLAIRDKRAYGKYRLKFVNVPHRLQIDIPLKRHYLGFIKNFDFDTGEIVFDYSRLLTHQIQSLPKIWVDDVNFFRWQDSLTASFTDDQIESQTAKGRDNKLQQLLEDGSIATVDSVFTDIESVESLPVLEDMNEG